jgi:hypothetical protein
MAPVGPREHGPWASDRQIITAAVCLVVLTLLGFMVGAWWAVAHWWPA